MEPKNSAVVQVDSTQNVDSDLENETVFVSPKRAPKDRMRLFKRRTFKNAKILRNLYALASFIAAISFIVTFLSIDKIKSKIATVSSNSYLDDSSSQVLTDLFNNVILISASWFGLIFIVTLALTLAIRFNLGLIIFLVSISTIAVNVLTTIFSVMAALYAITIYRGGWLSFTTGPLSGSADVANYALAGLSTTAFWVTLGFLTLIAVSSVFLIVKSVLSIVDIFEKVSKSAAFRDRLLIEDARKNDFGEISKSYLSLSAMPNATAAESDVAHNAKLQKWNALIANAKESTDKIRVARIDNELIGFLIDGNKSFTIDSLYVFSNSGLYQTENRLVKDFFRRNGKPSPGATTRAPMQAKKLQDALKSYGWEPTEVSKGNNDEENSKTSENNSDYVTFVYPSKNKR